MRRFAIVSQNARLLIDRDVREDEDVLTMLAGLVPFRRRSPRECHHPRSTPGCTNSRPLVSAAHSALTADALLVNVLLGHLAGSRTRNWLRAPWCNENVLTFLAGGLVLVAECLEYFAPKSSLRCGNMAAELLVSARDLDLNYRVGRSKPP